MSSPGKAHGALGPLGPLRPVFPNSSPNYIKYKIKTPGLFQFRHFILQSWEVDREICDLKNGCEWVNWKFLQGLELVLQGQLGLCYILLFLDCDRWLNG